MWSESFEWSIGLSRSLYRYNWKCEQQRLILECLITRRGLIDMRKRFRGNQPIAVDGKPSSSHMLYAGKPAFETVKEISGDEVQMDPEKTRGL